MHIIYRDDHSIPSVQQSDTSMEFWQQNLLTILPHELTGLPCYNPLTLAVSRIQSSWYVRLSLIPIPRPWEKHPGNFRKFKLYTDVVSQQLHCLAHSSHRISKWGEGAEQRLACLGLTTRSIVHSR